MLKIFDCIRDVTPLTVLVRTLIAFLCGGAVGMERSYKNRPAGIRTHILVCIGAMIASMTGVYLAVNRQFPTDLSRLGAQVVSGLGFIGAGTILVTRKKRIKGLTTAAGLWVTGIIGLAIGSGFYEGGIFTAVCVILVEILFADTGNRLRKQVEYHIRLGYQDKSALDSVLRACKDNRFAISNLQVTGTNDQGQPGYIALISLRSRRFMTIEALMKHISQSSGVLSAEQTEI
ncbi:MAG: MgtC/SapB family protein [Oscillospiraceae bacterium]|nr:MgtC/SapB family protein [Oscillospiraceae bacterium]